jgi:RHS repeat-associated protein
VGNRTSQTAPGGTTNYTYDANNRLTQAGTTTYTYDGNGNLTATSTGRTFTWDVFNRLTQATGPGGTVTHTYDGDGLKTRRVGPDGTRNYYYDGIKPIWETDGAGAMTAQYDRDIFGNLLSRREASGARRYYHFDGLGSTTALTNESGAATSTLLYDAWGNQRAASGSDQGRYRFTGAELDAATGLYHMGARFYDPTIGRWLSEDPVQDKHFEPATLNFYAYVHANPLVHTDPDGKVALHVAAGIVGAVLGLGIYAATHWDNMTIGGALTYAAVGGVIGLTLGAGASAVAARGAASVALGQIAAQRGNPEKVLGWATNRAGNVVAWLEQGTAKAGFQHIAEKHFNQFRDVFGNISSAALRDIVMQAAAKAGGPGTHVVRGIVYNNRVHDVLIVIAENGYIVTAHSY